MRWISAVPSIRPEMSICTVQVGWCPTAQLAKLGLDWA